MSISNLKHVERKLSGGGNIVVLDTGAAITPEAEAMIQALHSRSTGGVRAHLQTLEAKGAEKFMSSFYVGYGHKSIGDCGSITLFVEGVSMLAAKAIQDWRLYSGQESSTRYIDFSKQALIDPVGSSQSNKLLETWREFYLTSQEPLQAHLKTRFPRGADEKDSIYDKAISARAFDTLRGFLPAGSSTNLAWHSNLRQIADKLVLLRHHPLQEVKEIAEGIQDALLEACPSSFQHKRYDGTESYNAQWMGESYYFTHDSYGDEIAVLRDAIDREQLAENRQLLESRPAKTELPNFLAECGTMQLGFMLDFGSFRDIQRHRAVVQRMPLLTSTHGFHEWYLNELPEALRKQAKALLVSQEDTLGALNVNQETAQYYTPMGYSLPNRLTGDLPALVYLIELRATRFVHPTLQQRAVQMGRVLQERLGASGLKLHLDDDPGRFDVRRGEHDIVTK